MDRNPSDSPLDEVLARAADGEEEAWRTLVDRYASKVFAVVLRQCRDRELADEVTQTTFVKVVGSIRRYTERGRFEAWLFRIAMNQLRDEMRGRKRRAMPLTSGPDELGQDWLEVQASKAADSAAHDPVHRASRAEQIELLRQAIGRLSEADQRVLHLRHTAGLSFAQIAETLDEPLGTVLARGHRALGKLQKLMLQDKDG